MARMKLVDVTNLNTGKVASYLISPNMALMAAYLSEKGIKWHQVPTGELNAILERVKMTRQGNKRVYSLEHFSAVTRPQTA